MHHDALLTLLHVVSSFQRQTRDSTSAGCLVCENPPTPAFAKAGAAPGTTAGVDFVLFQTLQTFTLKQLPQQAPQIHSNDFLEAFKAAVCQPAKAATPPSPTGTPGPRPLPQQAPQGQGHFPNRHPKARPQQWLSMGFQSCRLPARKRSKTLQTLQTLQNPLNQAPQIYSNDFLAAFKAAVCQPAKAATPPSPTGTPGPGHSNGFLWAFKAAVCQPANAPKLSKRSKPSKTRQTLQTPSPAGTPDPQQ